MVSMLFPDQAFSMQTFEDGLLTGWVVGGRRDGVVNEWGVEEHPSGSGNNMAYLKHRGFSELILTSTYDYSPGAVLSFDAEFSIYGDNSPTAAGTSNRYSMVEYDIRLYDDTGNLLGGRYYAAATSRYPYNTRTEIRPNGIEHYEHNISTMASDLGISINDVDTFDLRFLGYSSITGQGFTTVYFDNVSIDPVPVPGAVWLLGSGIVGIVSLRKRLKS